MLKEKSPAKINLVLEILDRDITGYHYIETIYHEIPWYDKLQFVEQESWFELVCNNSSLPTDETNLIYKAFNLLREKFQVKRGLKINLEKNIPLGGGLGGGSSNAAATLKALNKLWKLKLSQKELLTLAAQIGMDVPFFILGGTAIGTHFGELVSILDNKLSLHILVVTPKIEINTKEAYESLDLSFPKQSRFFNKCKNYLERGDLNLLLNALHNDFEEIIFKKYPEIERIRNLLIEHGAEKSQLCGSGASVFGIFGNEEKLLNAKAFFSNQNFEVH